MSPKPSGGPDESLHKTGSDTRSYTDDFKDITENLGDVEARGREIIRQSQQQGAAAGGKRVRARAKFTLPSGQTTMPSGKPSGFDVSVDTAPNSTSNPASQSTDDSTETADNNNEPQLLTPAVLDPSNPDQDPYDTIDNAYEKAFDPTTTTTEQDVANQEADASDPEDKSNKPEMSQAERDRFNDDTLGKGYNASSKSDTTKGLARLLATRGFGRNSAITGGIVGAIALFVTLLSFATPSTQLVHWRNTFKGTSNRVASNRFAERRVKSLYTMLRKQSRGEAVAKAIDAEGFDAKWRAQGGIIERAATGEPIRFGHVTTGGVERLADLSGDYDAVYNQLFKGIEGREARRALNRVGSSEIAQFKGRVGRKLFSYLKSLPRNWLDVPDFKGPNGEELDATEQYSAKYRHSDDIVDPELASISGVKDLGQTDTDGDGKPDSEGKTGVADDTPDMEESADYRKRALEDPRLNDDELLNVEGLAKGAGDQIDNEMEDAAEGVLKNLKSGAPSLDAIQSAGAGLLTKGVGRIFSLVNATGAIENGCRLIGTIGFIANVRNIMLANELSRIAVKWLTVADHQMAGLQSSDAIRLMMIYMQHPNPQNGKVFGQAGGVLRLSGQVPDAYINPIHLAKAGVGRDTTGVWGVLNAIATAVPGVTQTTVCKTVTNGTVQLVTLAGTLVVSVIGAVVTGGGSLSINAENLLYSAALGIATEIAFQIGTPLLVKVGARLALNGLEKNGEFVGNMIASGVGAYFSASASANGGRIATKQEFAAAKAEADAEYREEIAQQSLFERYLDFANADSLLSRVAFSLPIGARSMITTVGFALPGVAASAGNPGSLATSLLPFGKVSAANEVECKDPQVVAHNLQTDAFCNLQNVAMPDLNLEKVEAALVARTQIDASGNPKPSSDFEKYINNCHSGRAGTAYVADMSKDGSDGNGFNNDCFTDPAAEVKDYEPACNGDIKLCYAAWWGFLTDQENLSEESTDTYEPVGANQTATNTSTRNTPQTTGGGNVTGCPTEPVDYSQIVSVGGIEVHTCIKSNLERLIADASAAGFTVSGSGWRDINRQIELRIQHCGSSDYAIYEMPSSECSPPTAIPGRSNHEKGTAIDFDVSGGMFEWLQANAAKYGLYNLPSEAWHWSTTGD